MIRVLATTSRYDLAVAANPASGGTATDQTDEGPYEKDTEISIQAAQNTGYDFTGWQASSGSFADEDALETTFTMPDVNATVTATFELIDYTLTLLADPSEGGTVSGYGDYNYNDEVQVDAIPNTGWAFVEWTGDIGYINDPALGTVTVTMPAGNVTLTANFELIDYTLTLTADPEAGGSVEDVTGDAPYNIGDAVYIKAEASEGWEFTGWTGDYAGQLVDASEAETTLTMPADDVDLTANFQMVDYTLTLIANPQEGGDVEGAGKFNFEENVTITATPEEGWEFINWTDDDDGDAVVSTDESFTFNMPAADVNYTANFLDYPIYGDGVEDIDGNIYQTVIIGDQEWMAENLRVTKYKNDDPIPTGFSNNDWVNTNHGAFAIYDHEKWEAEGIDTPEEMVEAYGNLYNWYAVDDPRGLCPVGWHVPSEEDWNKLMSFLSNKGYQNAWTDQDNAGNALKSCRQVNSPLGGDCDTSTHPRWDNFHSDSYGYYGFDEFGFSALPGGQRMNNGDFINLGYEGYWWSSSNLGSSGNRTVIDRFGGVVLSGDNIIVGKSVRCVRDLVRTEDD